MEEHILSKDKHDWIVDIYNSYGVAILVDNVLNEEARCSQMYLASLYLTIK